MASHSAALYFVFAVLGLWRRTRKLVWADGGAGFR